MDETTYTIQELAEAAGIPRRTIHFYVQQGILPPPQGAGLGARYAEGHLLRLRLTPLLRSTGLRLDEIRAVFGSSAEADLQAEYRRLSAAAPPVILPPPPPLNLPGERYIHYRLPGGALLIVPEKNASPALTARLEQLLNEFNLSNNPY